MEILNYCRGCGKTHDIVEYAKKNRCAVVVSSYIERDYIKRVYEFEDVYTIKHVVDFRGITLSKYNCVVVDNLELVLGNLFVRPVKAVTITGAEILEKHFPFHVYNFSFIKYPSFVYKYKNDIEKKQQRVKEGRRKRLTSKLKRECPEFLDWAEKKNLISFDGTSLIIPFLEKKLEVYNESYVVRGKEVNYFYDCRDAVVALMASEGDD